MDTSSGLDFCRSLPETPGVYKMYNGKNLLYVGKAKNLRSRVSSYFTKDLDARLRRMIAQVSDIQTIVVPSEIDALILESKLVKKENPKYNIMLKDDRGYPYLHVSTDQPVPTLSIAYKKAGQGKFFGPFPSRHSVREAFEVLNSHFKLRTCDDYFFRTRTRPCLEYQIARCSAPCVNKISPQEYEENVKSLCRVLDGKSTEALLAELSAKMEKAASELEYEKALSYRDKITSLRHVQSKISVEAGEGDYDVVAVSSHSSYAAANVLFVRSGQIIGSHHWRFEKGFDESDFETMKEAIVRFILEEAPHATEILADVSEEQASQLSAEIQKTFSISVLAPSTKDQKSHVKIATDSSLAALKSILSSRDLRATQITDMVDILGLSVFPHRVECFDISHTQGQDTVASQVVFGDHGPIKNAYRRYNINNAHGDDLLAMREALLRRFKHQENLPDLLLIDGGATQVGVALDVLSHYDLDIPCVGVSKGAARIEGEEVLIMAQTGQEWKLGSRSPALQYIQAVRNEAHRFAIEGHRKKRNKRMVASSLELIPGVGKSRRQELLSAFGGFEGLKNARLEEIEKVKGVGKNLAKEIFSALHPS